MKFVFNGLTSVSAETVDVLELTGTQTVQQDGKIVCSGIVNLAT